MIPGFGDQRELELLVEAGFTPLEAIKIGTLNGATYLGLADRIGSIAAGKNADLFIVNGNPAAKISDVENVVRRVQGRGRVRKPQAARQREGALRPVLISAVRGGRA